MKYLLYLLLSVFLLLGLGELAARAVMPRQVRNQGSSPYFSGTLESDPELLWRLRPGVYQDGGIRVRVNSMGTRGPEVEMPKPVGPQRVLFVGDSSVFGYGVGEEESFPFQTAALLNRRFPGGYEAVNAAVPGYSSAQCVLVTERLLEKLQPDWVVIASLWSDMMRLPWTDAEMMEKFSAPRRRIAHRLRSFTGRSAVMRFLAEKYGLFQGPPDDHRIVFSSVFDYEQKGKKHRKRRVGAVDHLKNLREMIQLCRRRGTKAVLLILPCLDDQVGSPRELDRVITDYRRNFHDAGRDLDATIVDVTPLFRRHPLGGDRPLFIDDLHPNPAGHELIARALVEGALNPERPPP